MCFFRFQLVDEFSVAQNFGKEVERVDVNKNRRDPVKLETTTS